MTQALGRTLGPVLTVLALLLIWQGGSLWMRTSYLPPISDIAPIFVDLIRSGEIWPDLIGSLQRLAIGFALGVAIGIPLGLGAGRNARIDDFFTPLLGLFYPVPKAALMPILMLWFGAGSLSKIIVITMTVSLPLIYHAREGARRVNEKLLWSAAAVGCGPLRRMWKVVLPAALPEILLGTRVAIVIGVIVMITSEMIVRQEGLGALVFTTLDMGQYAMTYAVILVISIIGFVLDRIFEAIRRRLTAWAPEREDRDIVAAS